MAKVGGNPQKFLKNKVPLSERTTAVRLPVDIDRWVHSLPNKTEWLREAIAAQYMKDLGETDETVSTL